MSKSCCAKFALFALIAAAASTTQHTLGVVAALHTNQPSNSPRHTAYDNSAQLELSHNSDEITFEWDDLIGRDSPDVGVERENEITDLDSSGGEQVWNSTKFARPRDALHRPLAIRRLDSDGVELSSLYTPKAYLMHAPRVVLKTDAVERLFEQLRPMLGGTGGSVSIIPYLSRSETTEGSLVFVLKAYHSFSDRMGLQLDLPFGIFIGYPSLRDFYKQIGVEFSKVLSEISASGGGSSTRSTGAGDTRISVNTTFKEEFVSATFFLSAVIPTSRIGSSAAPEILPGPDKSSLLGLLDSVASYATKMMFGPRRGVGHLGMGAGVDMKLKVPLAPISLFCAATYTHYFSAKRFRFVPPNGRVDLLSIYLSTQSRYGEPLPDLIPERVLLSVRPGNIFSGLTGIRATLGAFTLEAGFSLYAQEGEQAELSSPGTKHIHADSLDRPIKSLSSLLKLSSRPQKFPGTELFLFVEKRIAGAGGDSVGVGFAFS